MNAKEYVEELMLRLSRFDVIKDLNEPLMLTYINKGRQQAQRFTIGYMPERYSRISEIPINPIPVTNYTLRDYYGKIIRMYPVPLPNDFIEVYRVILKYRTASETVEPELIQLFEGANFVPAEDDGVTYTVVKGSCYHPGPQGTLYNVGDTFIVAAGDEIFSLGSGDVVSRLGNIIVWGNQREIELRQYIHEEIYQTNILSINPPTIITPIYVVMANNDINYRLLIAGLDLSSNNNIFADENYSDVMCEVWYTVAINELEGRNSNNQIDNEVTLPIHIEELAINYAMLHCLRHVKHEEGIQLLIQEVQLLESMFMQNFEQNIVATNLELATSQEVK